MTVIHDETRPGIGRVTIYDRGHATCLGRYQVSRTMQLANGKVKITHIYRHQRPAAIAHAQKWLDQRQAFLAQATSRPPALAAA